jgi:hypothetical protein
MILSENHLGTVNGANNATVFAVESAGGNEFVVRLIILYHHSTGLRQLNVDQASKCRLGVGGPVQRDEPNLRPGA